ncbi:MAG: DUF523 domain-containing protein [Gammaproteobacteria bacterium]|nr:DUF523 domain-containing protein [Gammaproteobacteria bacterium]MBU1655603.1 DUF523 domain-containing protein [Gammaproteobacteria bacterium]MBU1962275.1 DUF523 domain-containing protein [Gammaproteobacteria bacterium]
MNSPRPIIAVSSCLLGQRVRYDGTDKYDPWIVELLGREADFLPICPEVGIGLGIPRAPIRLMRVAGRVRALGIEDPSLDVTARLSSFALETLNKLRGVSGYILKDRSPSCGLGHVKLFSDDRRFERNGVGIHAAIVRAALPDLPMADEGRVQDPRVREAFVQQVFARHRRLARNQENVPRSSRTKASPSSSA